MNSTCAKQMLLVSYEYPFGSSETFLESEIEHLTKQFDIVWVLPSRAAWSPSWFSAARHQHRALPKGCRLVSPQPDLAWWAGVGVAEFVRLVVRAQFLRVRRMPFLPQVRVVAREAVKAVLLARAVVLFLEGVGARLYAYSYWKSPAASALALLKESGVVPGFITRCHGGDLYYEVLRYPIRPFDRLVADQSDAVVAVSQHGADYLTEHGFQKDKVVLCRLGVRVKALAKSSNDGVLRIVSCSNIVPIKRLDVLANALCDLAIPFEWTHFGDGTDCDIIGRIVLHLPTHGRACFRGRVSNDEVLSHYAEAPVDLFVNTSLSEGIPISIMEALVAGIPCIATNVGGTSEIVDENCGMLVDPRIDAKALARLLESVSTNRRVWEEKRIAARLRGIELCNAERNHRQISELLVDKMAEIDKASARPIDAYNQ